MEKAPTTKILIVDDDEQVVSLIEMMLKTKGFVHFETAHSYQEARAILNPSKSKKDGSGDEKPVDIVISDVILPDVNGFELCQELKAERPEVKVLLISGYNIEDLQDKILDSDADDFLTKPFAPTELQARVELLIEKSKNP